MTIEFKEGDYIVGLWFVELPNQDDWMCCVKKSKDSNVWEGKYRFRTRVDDNIFNSKDKKRWTSFTSKPDVSEAEIISIQRRVAENLASIAKLTTFTQKVTFDELLIQGDMELFLEKAKNSKKDWLNMESKTIHPEGNA